MSSKAFILYLYLPRDIMMALTTSSWIFSLWIFFLLLVFKTSLNSSCSSLIFLLYKLNRLNQFLTSNFYSDCMSLRSDVPALFNYMFCLTSKNHALAPKSTLGSILDDWIVLSHILFPVVQFIWFHWYSHMEIAFVFLESSADKEDNTLCKLY